MSDDKKDICENMHIMDYGDIEDTLYNAGIGIWSIELHDDSEPCMYADKTMNMLLDIKIEDTPQYRYQEWSSRIDSDYLEQVMKSVDSMVKNGKSECTYAWHHPKLGKRYVRCGGVCDKNFKNGIKLKGYHQDVTDIQLKEEKHKRVLSEQYAVIDALRSKPLREGTGEIAPPTFQSSRQVAPNGKINHIFVTMKAPEGTVIHYTTDGSEPTEDSPTPSQDPIFHEDFGADLRAGSETYPDGRVILLKAAAFQDGKRSETVTGRYVFANPNPKHSYELGQFSGKAEGITARVEFESPNFDQKYYLTKIRLDDVSEKTYAAFLPELFSQIYLKQGVEGVTPISGHEEESRKVIAAVQAALHEGFVAAEPVITITPKQGNYSNDDKVNVEITCATEEAEIYYVVDNSNDITGGRLSDFEKHKVLYEKPLTLTIENPQGGTLYIRAAAKTGQKNWSPTARKDLPFVKAVGKEAFEVNGSKYGTWKEAVSALEKAGSGEIILRDDVELQEKDEFPSVSCTIRSGDERKCKIKGGVMEAKADIAFENVVYDVRRIYGNGHSVTIGTDVETTFSFMKRSIFAGVAYDAEEKDSR